MPPIVDIDGWKIGVMTCYDVRFPETARSLAVRGADVIVVSAAWVRGALKEQHWKLLNAARALEKHVLRAGVQRGEFAEYRMQPYHQSDG